MARKLEAAGHIRRKPAPSDRRASVVELTDSGKALADQIKQLWCALAEETVAGLSAETVTELPGILRTLTGNVDTRSTPPTRPPAQSSPGTAAGRTR
jgi:DNA-binding MarR family transcriptional regulator